MEFSQEKSQRQTQQNKNNAYLWLNPDFNRKDKTVINRLRIGHSHPTHSFLMSKGEPPLYDSRSVPFTVNHTTIECQKYQSFRNQYHISEQFCQVLRSNPLDVKNLILFETKSELSNLI